MLSMFNPAHFCGFFDDFRDFPVRFRTRTLGIRGVGVKGRPSGCVGIGVPGRSREKCPPGLRLTLLEGLNGSNREISLNTGELFSSGRFGGWFSSLSPTVGTSTESSNWESPDSLMTS